MDTFFRKKNTHSSRSWIAPLLACIVLVVLALRAFDLQIVQGKELKEVAEQNRVFHKRIIANRGILLDRFGKPLVYNKPIYYQLQYPNRLYTQRTVIEESKALDLLTASASTVFTQQYREYVAPESLSQVVGYVAPVNKEDLDRNPDFHLHQFIGKVGLEAVYEPDLAGIDGEVVYETNAKGEILRKISEQEPKSGDTIRTTLDSELSDFVFSLLKGKKGAIMVGNSDTGEVLSLVSSPTFNANDFSRPVYSEQEEQERRSKLNQYFQDPNKLFFNRALAGGYPPGSIFKPVTALGGLEADAFDAETTVDDEGILKVGDFEYGNWYYSQYGRVEGSLSLVRAIARSNDIFFYKAAEWLGPDRLAQMARLLGLGAKTGIELPAEASGIVPDPQWKEKTIGEHWFLGNTYHFGIGQGDLLVTPVQMFQVLTLFANRGKLCAPTLIKNKEGNCKNISVTQEHLDLIREGMQQACSSGGTAYPFFPWNSAEEDKVFCKTGTAEFGAADAKGHRKTHGWFEAFTHLPLHELPMDQSSVSTTHVEQKKEQYPQNIAIIVLVESDEDQPYKEGSRDAAPLALEILKWLKAHR